MQIEITPEAQDDILEGMFWYESQKADLGIAFFSEIERNLTIISQNPLAGREFSGKFRRAVMKKFPFCIYYLVNSEKIGNRQTNTALSDITPLPIMWHEQNQIRHQPSGSLSCKRSYPSCVLPGTRG
jgi:hypothetical protein